MSQGTHWHGCHTAHIDCAVAKIEQLKAELKTEQSLSFRNQMAQLEAERDALVQALECLIEIEPEHCACGAPECRDMSERFTKARAAIDAARSEK